METTLKSVTGWRPPVFKSFDESSNLASGIFGHAFGVAVAFLTYDVVKSWLHVEDDDAEEQTMPLSLRRFIQFLAAFIAGALAFFIMWFLFGLGRKSS